MSNTKLNRIGERLYEAQRDDGGVTKWEKDFEDVKITLTQIRTEYRIDIKRAETSLYFQMDEKQQGYEQTIHREQVEPDEAHRQSTKNCFKESYWIIVGVGHLNESHIGLIKKDGHLSLGRDAFTNIDVSMRPAPDANKEYGYGYLYFNDGQYAPNHDGPFIGLQIYPPQTEFDKICESLASGSFTGVELVVFMDVFASEVDRFFGHTAFRKNIYIEENATVLNQTYLFRLSGFRSEGQLAPNDPRELFAAPGFRDQKTNFFGNRLLDIEQFFNEFGAQLFYTALAGIVVYLGYRALAWLWGWPA